MLDDLANALDDVRTPEHTGENRCWPCTVANAVLLAVACACVERLFPARRSVRTAAAVALGAAGGSAIALRGYLVPGTPELTGVLLHGRDSTGATRGPDPEAVGSLAGDAADGEQVADALLDAGVLHAVGETLHLDERFRDRWREEMRAIRGDGDDGDIGNVSDEDDYHDDADLVTAIRDAAPGTPTVEVVEDGRWVVVARGGPATETWLSRPVAVAEAGAVHALADEVPEIPAELRVQAAPALRAFLETCPVCDAALETTTTARCCASATNPLAPPEEVLACPDCGQHAFTF